MRIRATLGLGIVTGLLITAVFWGIPSDGVTWLCVSTLGMLLGAIAAACILATDRWPRRITALLVSLAPSLSLIGAVKGISALLELPSLLVILLLATLLRRASTRHFITFNILTAVIIAYAVAGLPAAFLSGSLTAASTNLFPLALYFVGMLLQSGPPHASLGGQRASLLRLLAPALLCGSIVLAVLALLLKPTGDAAESCALSLAALVLLAISWDSRRFSWRLILGFPDRVVRVGVVLVSIAFLLTSILALKHLATPGIVVAFALALGMVALSRQRFSEIALVIVSFMPLLSGFGLEWLKPPLLSLYSSLNISAWHAALAQGASTPFGGGFDGESGFRLYQGTFASTGVSGFAALVLMFALLLIMCGRTYVRLRPSSGEAGGMLAAGGICVFVVVAGLFSNPLASPALAMMFWLFLGMANGSIEAVRQVVDKEPNEVEQTHFERLRGYPLRIAYVLPGDATGESASAFADYLHAFDRRRVRPLLLAIGAGPLVSLAQGLNVEVRVIKSLHRQGVAPVAKQSSRFAWSKPGLLLSFILRSLDLRRWTLRRTARMVQAALFLEPDLLVSLDPALHLITLSAGRLSGVPVQWHGHDVASKGVQRSLDTLAPWTVGILAPSQTIARTYNIRLVGRNVKVLRPGILLDGPPLVERSTMRQRLRIAEDASLLAVIGPITAKSGHADLLQALIPLRETMPRLRVVLMEEAPPHASLENSHSAVSRSIVNATDPDVDAAWCPERLRNEIAAHGLEDVVLLLGPRADALEILAASDVVVFPHERPMESRNLLLALAAGTPLVATSVGTHVELLSDAWGYLLVKTRDPQGLVLAVTSVLQQQALFRTNARRNPALVRDWFSPQVETGRLVRIYSDICQPEGQTLRLPTRQEVAPLQRHWITALWNPRAAE